MTTELLFAEASTAVLASWWKMILIAIPFIPWGWLISTKLDKDARYFHLNWQAWNAAHLAAGAAALAAMLFIPIFWASWPVGVIILAAPVLTYWVVRNKSVPEDQVYTLSGQSMSDRMEMRRKERARRQAFLEFENADGSAHPTPVKDDPLFATHMSCEDIVGPALEARASRIDVLLSNKGCIVAQTVDGMRYKREPLSAEQGTAVIDYLKEIAGLDVNDRRRRQTGTFKMRAGDGDSHTMTLTTLGSSSGVQVRLDVDRAKQLRKPFDALGLLPSQLDSLRELEQVHELHGIVLLGAPTGQGLTTTAYAMLARHDAFTTNVKSLESEVAAYIDGVDQSVFDSNDPNVDYATSLQSILRRDPDIVLIDILKDAETGRISAAPGMQGPLLYIQQTSSTIAEQIRDWVKYSGSVEDASAALRAIVNQRLIRTLCPNCRQPYTPAPEQLKKLNVPADKAGAFHRASGKVQLKNKIVECAVCSGTGYLGQTGIFQVMVVDDAIRKILKSGDLKAALAQARRNKMIYLQEAAMSKVVSGETTLEEVIRVISGGPQKSKSASAQPVPSS